MLDGRTPTSENDPADSAGEDHEDRPENLNDPGRQTCKQPRVGPSQEAPDHCRGDQDGDGQQRKPDHPPDRRTHEQESDQKPCRDESIGDDNPRSPSEALSAARRRLLWRARRPTPWRRQRARTDCCISGPALTGDPLRRRDPLTCGLEFLSLHHEKNRTLLAFQRIPLAGLDQDSDTRKQLQTHLGIGGGQCDAAVRRRPGAGRRFKPTVGLVSRSGIIPISASQDTAGPMARTVADAAALLTVLAGYDPDDPATASLRDHPPPDYRGFLVAASLQGVRIGVIRHYAGFHEEVDGLFERALAVLRQRGAVLVDPVDIATADRLDAVEQTVLAYEFKDGINRYLATRQGSGPRTLQDLIAFNEREAAREMPFFGQELFIEAQAMGNLNDPKYLEGYERATRLAGREGIDATLAKDHLDALVAPTVGPPWTTDLINGDHVLGGGVTTPPAVAGYPHVTVPMGAVHGLPVGVSFVGAAWTEGRLISYAYAFEQSTHAREAPKFPRTVP